MKGRSIAISLLTALCVACVSSFIVLATMQSTLLDREAMKRWLSQTSTYGTVVTVVANAAGSQFSNPLIPSSAIEGIVRQVLTADSAQASTEKAIDEYYNWLEGDPAPPSLTLAFNNNRVAASDHNPQMVTLTSVTGQSGQAAQAPQASGITLPKTISLLKLWVQMAPIIAIVSAVLIFILATARVQALLRLSSRLLLATLITLVVGLSMVYYGKLATLGYVSDNTHMVMRQVLVPIINAAVPDVGNKLVVISSGVAVLTALAWVVLYVIKRQFYTAPRAAAVPAAQKQTAATQNADAP